jgi:HD-GYP domain-containing protein (c-di-GMP phosphodiesterase class II)
MAKQKDAWISVKEAAEIMTQNSGHTVNPDYVRLLSNQSKIRARAKDGRTKEYLKSDVENYKVTGKGKNKKPATEEKDLSVA